MPDNSNTIAHERNSISKCMQHTIYIRQTHIRGLFDKFVELCNESVNFEYLFFNFSHVIYLPDFSTLFKFQLSNSLTFLNIGYRSNICVASCRTPFFTKIVICVMKRNPRRIAKYAQTKQTMQ